MKRREGIEAALMRILAQENWKKASSFIRERAVRQLVTHISQY